MIKGTEVPEVELPVRLSPSAMNSFSSCFAQFAYSREWSLKEEYAPKYFKFGSEVHNLMDGSLDPRDASPDAVDRANRLKKKEAQLGLYIVARELRQEFMVEGARFVRRIDALGYEPDGTPVIIDYKTASRPWGLISTGGGPMPPNAYSWSSIGYMVDPDDSMMEELKDDYGWDDVWPKKMYYIIAPSSGKDQVFDVSYHVKWEERFRSQVRRIVRTVENEDPIKEMGYSCYRCTMKGICLDAPSWTEEYERR